MGSTYVQMCKTNSWKILHVVRCLPPDGAGGIQTHVLSLVTEQAKRHDVSVVTFTHRPADETTVVERIGAVSVYRLQYPPKQARRFDERWPELEEVFEQTVRLLQPDVVHLHELCGLSSELVVLSKRIGAVVVFTLHDYLTICPTHTIDYRGQICFSPGKKCYSCLYPDLWSRRRRLPYWRLTNPLSIALGSILPNSSVGNRLKALQGRKEQYFSALRRADGLIAVSRAQAQVFDAAGLGREVRVIPHGVCPPKATLTRSGVHTPIRFGFVGHHLVKGLNMLLEVFAENNFEAELWAYAEIDRYPWPLRKKIKGLSRRGNIRILGEFPPERCDEVYAALDVLVAPSVWVEPLGLVAAEAIARGVPVIASDSCGFEEIVRNGVNGVLFRRGDKNSLKLAMKQFVDEPALVERLRSNCKMEMDIGQEARHVEELYGELLRNAAYEREG